MLFVKNIEKVGRVDLVKRLTMKFKKTPLNVEGEMSINWPNLK